MEIDDFRVPVMKRAGDGSEARFGLLNFRAWLDRDDQGIVVDAALGHGDVEFAARLIAAASSIHQSGRNSSMPQTLPSALRASRIRCFHVA